MVFLRHNKVSRRRLFHGFAAVGALPFLARIPSALAQPGRPRIVFFKHSNPWMDPDYRTPAGTGADRAVKAADLPSLMEPLAPHVDKLLITDGWNGHGDKSSQGHAHCGPLLSGKANLRPPDAAKGPGDVLSGGPTVDQVIAKRREERVLYLASMPGPSRGQGRASWLDAAQPDTPVTSPATAFSRIFGGAPGSPADKLRRQKLSMLDLLIADLPAYQSRLPGEDRRKLDQHLTHLRSLEKALSVPAAQCAGAPVATDLADKLPNYPNNLRLHARVIAQALACNLSSVAMLQAGRDGGGNIVPVWPEEKINAPYNEHLLIHDFSGFENNYGLTQDAAVTNILAASRFQVAQLANLIREIDALADTGGRTVLDNSLVVSCTGMGVNHRNHPMMFVLAGSAGGRLKTGRYLDVGVGSRAANAPIGRGGLPEREWAACTKAQGCKQHQDLLVTLCHLMGLQDVTTFGDPAWCNGPANLG